MISKTDFPRAPQSCEFRKTWITVVLCAVGALGLHRLLPVFAAGLSQAEPSFAGEVFPWVSIPTQATIEAAHATSSHAATSLKFIAVCAGLFAICGVMLWVTKGVESFAIQAFIFQDGGVLALGANVFNMAIAGVLAGYLPYRVWGNTGARRTAIFLGGFLSVLVGASLALVELLISGVRMPRTVILVSVGLFCISALIEGAITLSVLEAIGKLNPGWVRGPSRTNNRVAWVLGGVALALTLAGFLIASTDPDGLEKLGMQLGMTARTAFQAPLADYSAPIAGSVWVRRAAAGLTGLIGIYGACLLIGRLILQRKHVQQETV